MSNNELSYYRLSLLSFLKESHPELAKDSDFITSRGDLATKAYSDSIKNGVTHEQANKIANEVLFKGLHFSKYDTIINILWNEFAEEIPQGSAKDFALKTLPVCESVFAKYSLSDEFAFTPEYELLYTELTGTIVIWLEENEL
jgi:hypothetical protein